MQTNNIIVETIFPHQSRSQITDHYLYSYKNNIWYYSLDLCIGIV